MRRGDAGRMLRNVALILGLLGVIALGAIALFGPQLSAADPQAQRLVLFYPDGTFKVPPTPPDQYNPLGTDPLGRDQLARILWGARLTFTVVLLALLLRAFLAVFFGVLAGWRGGNADALVMLGTNAIAGVPQLLLALLVAVALREYAIFGFVVALGSVGWAEGAQFVRAEVMRIRRSPYVEAARALGTRTSGLITRHLLRALAPQLFGLFALEAGATLLLLAELGFLGVFMSGAIVLVDNNNRPILPVRDRAPEWGQMLAGATQYAFSNQFVAFVPGVVVAAAVFAFNLLGEGARAATDPFSGLSLSPRAVGSLGRALLAVALLGGVFFGVAEARSTEVSFDDALRLAREAAERVEPGDELVAAVVRYRSDSHALAKPEKMNFYFRSHGIFEILRVGFPDADQNAMEVLHDDQDGIKVNVLRTLDAWSVPLERALAIGEEGGRAFRNSSRGWLVRVVLTHQTAFPVPTYRVTYSAPSAASSPNIDVLIDAVTGEFDTRELRFAEATLRAENALGGPVALTQATGRWSARGPQGTPGGGFDADKPVGVFYTFIRADLPADRRTAFVGFGTFAQAGVSASIGSSTVRGTPIGVTIDLEAVFAAVEARGGRALRDDWSREGVTQWSANANVGIDGATSFVRVSYGAPPSRQAAFQYDLATGRVERTP
jgi:peptide/nickel transport system permease protein